MKVKICCRCHEPKSESDFPKYKTKPDGLNQACKECTSIKSKEVRVRRKWRVLYHYTKGTMKCSCCDENRFEFLTLDHIDGDGSKHRKSIKLMKKDPIDMIGRIKHSAILFVAGDKDWVIKDHHSRILYAAALEPKRLEIIKGGGHAERLIQKDSQMMKDLMLSWFAQTIKTDSK